MDLKEYYKTYHKRYYQLHKAELAKRHKEYYINVIAPNREHYNAQQRAWAQQNKDKVYKHQHKNRLKRGYNLSIEEYEQLVLAQDNKCAICGREMIRPCVDHDHMTGKIRGLLCSNCNSGLGQFGDNREILQNAIIYLSKEKV